MYLGNIMLLVVETALDRGLRYNPQEIPVFYVFPFIILFWSGGAISLNNNVAEVIMMVIFGSRYFMKKIRYDPAVMLLH